MAPSGAGGTAASLVLEPSGGPPQVDAGSRTAVSPAARPQPLIREGEYVRDRVGRLARAADGSWEFVFEADGQSLQDPPMVVIPSLKLMAMETALNNRSRDLRFRITGMVTEYNGRNYVLLEKVVVVADRDR